jgi:hypothetical protein
VELVKMEAELRDTLAAAKARQPAPRPRPDTDDRGMKAYVRLKAGAAGIACLALAACDYAGFGPGPRASPPPAGPPPCRRRKVLRQWPITRRCSRPSAEGLLRTDPGGEIPVTPEILAREFPAVALYDEYRRDATGFVREETESRLRRWVVPIRVAVRFGPSVPADRQAPTAPGSPA